MSSEEFSRLDVAIVNLACAADLPDTAVLDVEECLRKLDCWAILTRQFTEQRLPRFFRKRENYYHSEAYFRVLAMVTVLQRDLGLRYNPEKVPSESVFSSADSFLHGAVLGEGGTCASIPVVYAAVGRRLGYPIKLVSARGRMSGHLFARWDEPGRERFNIEATNRGLTCPPDTYYREGEYLLSPEEEVAGGYLQSMTPCQELATFLLQRGFQLADAGINDKTAEAFGWASALVPHLTSYRTTFRNRLCDWRDKMDRGKPKHFPQVWVKTLGRHFPPSVPAELELFYHGLQTTQELLQDPRLEKEYWAPLRRGERLPILPARAVAERSPAGCRVTLDFIRVPTAFYQETGPCAKWFTKEDGLILEFRDKLQRPTPKTKPWTGTSDFLPPNVNGALHG
jgi:hypothetical protein